MFETGNLGKLLSAETACFSSFFVQVKTKDLLLVLKDEAL
jgi:hypothetical protein